jgi:hypothetical protein
MIKSPTDSRPSDMPLYRHKSHFAVRERTEIPHEEG